MDIREIRKRNLRLLIAQVGSTQGLAEKADTNPDWLSALASDNPPLSSTGKPRGMGSVLARKIEHGMNLPPGWMDTLHGQGEAQEMLNTLFAGLDSENQRKLLEVARKMLEIQALTGNGNNKPPTKTPPKKK